MPDVVLPSPDDDELWGPVAVARDRIVALLEDEIVAEVEGLGAVRTFRTRRAPLASEEDRFELDPSAAPPRPTLIHDGETSILERETWRKVNPTPDGHAVTCATAAGVFLLCEHILWRLASSGWSRAAAFAEPYDNEPDRAPVCLAFDWGRGVLLGATHHDIVALTRSGWQHVLDAPGRLVQLATDRGSERLVAATADATFALPLALVDVVSWIPGSLPFAPPATDAATPLEGHLELTVEVFEPPDRTKLGQKRGELLLALLPPDLALFERSTGERLRIAKVPPELVPPAPVLFEPMHEHHHVCRVVPDIERSGRSRLGGAPEPIQEPLVRSCKRCKRPLRFRAQLCEDIYDCYFGDAGRVYVFDCVAGCGAEVFAQS